MTESEQRKKVRVFVAIGIAVSLGMMVWIVYSVRTRQYDLLARSGPLMLFMGLLLLGLGTFFATKAVRSAEWSSEGRLLLLSRAGSSLVFGLAFLLHGVFGVSGMLAPLMVIAISLIGLRIVLLGVSGLRFMRKERRER